MIDLKEIKNNILKKENCYFLAIILFIFGLDRYSKIEIINNFSDTSVYLNDFLNFDLIWNTGIGFGLLKSNTALFYNLISTLIGLVVIILFFLALRSKSFDKIIYSIIIGGALEIFTIEFSIMQYQILLIYITETFTGLLLILQIYLLHWESLH